MRIFVITMMLWLVVLSGVVAQAQSKVEKANLIINTDIERHTISKHIYGHFAEHLGRCIYGGFFVGEDSPIPNTNGMRNDVLKALRELHIPNLRWPGGCFADEYHWMDGIGPRNERPKMINTHWGGVVEDNSFGTHEFLTLCELLDTEPYICGNVGSGTVEEMSKWIEYITFEGESPMANLRRENGREAPWKVKYWGVGNENWGCGGHMTPEYYADLYNRFATYCRDFGDNKLYKVAGGANSFDYNWTDVMIKKVSSNRMQGLSLHYYTVPGTWQAKGSATDFDKKEYLTTLEKALALDELLSRHSVIMDKFDPDKKVEIILDEWGNWFDVEPGTNPGFLYQQSSMRDAITAALSFHIMHKHGERVHMANIAQTINVLQAMILTQDDKMILTPSYHIFEMFKVHQDATFIPVELNSHNFAIGESEIKAISASLSKDKNGKMHLSIANADLEKDVELNCDIRGADVSSVNGRILTAPSITSHNTFEKPEVVKPKAFTEAKIRKNVLSLTIPAKSVLVLELN